MAMPDDPPRSPVRRDLLVIIALTAVLAVPSMLTRDLWGPDEPRYTEVAREMLVRHDFLVPHLNGEVYPDKPPLFFWLTAGLYRAGLGLKSAPALVALACLATLLATYFFSRRFLHGEGPLLAALATLSCLLFVADARTADIDPLEMLLVSSSTLCGYLALRGGGPRVRRWWLAAYALAGLATLTKGPVGLFLPGVALLAYGLLDRKRVRGGGMAHAYGALLLALIVLAWLVPAIASAGRSYARAVLVEQSVGRVVGSFGHMRPFYYYVSKAPALFFPWTLLLVPAVYRAVRGPRDDAGSLPLFAAVWLGAVVLFLSCVTGKRTDYLLPAVPAAGILVGWYLGGAGPAGRSRADLWLLRVPLAVLALAAAGAAALTFLPQAFVKAFGLETATAAGVDRVLDQRWHASALALLSLPIACAVAGWVWARKRLALAAMALVVGLVLSAVWFDLSVARVEDPIQSPRAFCRGLQPLVETGGPLYLYNSEFAGMINLYLARVSIPVLEEPDQLRNALRAPGSLVLSDTRHFGEVLTKAEMERATVYRGQIGRRQMVLLRGAQP